MGIKGILATFVGLGTVGSGVAGGYYLLNKKDNPNKEEQASSSTTEITDPITLPQPPQEKVAPPSNMKAFLATKNLTPLDVKNSDDKEKLGKLVEKYSSLSGSARKIQIEGFTDDTQHKETNINALVATCKKLLEITSDFENNEEKVTNWCTSGTTLLG